jgi:hypothetical protein
MEYTIVNSSWRRSNLIYYLLYLELWITRYQFHKIKECWCLRWRQHRYSAHAKPPFKPCKTGLVMDRTADQRGGSEWESIKNFLEGDGYSNKMNAATKHVSDSTTQVGQDHVATGVLLVLWTNTHLPNQNTLTRTAETARLAACVALVTPMACAGQTCGRSRSAGGYSNHKESFQKTSEKPTQNLAKQLQTSWELTSSTMGRNHTR